MSQKILRKSSREGKILLLKGKIATFFGKIGGKSGVVTWIHNSCFYENGNLYAVDLSTEKTGENPVYGGKIGLIALSFPHYPQVYPQLSTKWGLHREYAFWFT